MIECSDCSLQMAESQTNDQLSTFLKSGIYRFESSNALFIDPVRILNRSYTRFRVSPSSYYSRFFESNGAKDEPAATSTGSRRRKRKQKEKRLHTLNEREQIADQRHQEAKPLLLKAHEALLEATDLLAVIRNLRSERCSSEGCQDLFLPSIEQSFVELASVWQAPLYEITLNFPLYREPTEGGGLPLVHSSEQRLIPVFNNLVVNETSKDVEAEFLNTRYIIPRKSSFYMSDLGKIHDLIPAESDCGFNLILVDPPWENGSARQKLKYPTLPNRYFLSLPIKQLTHTEGALLALWVTNREKLRGFVEKELYPSWGVKYMATLYWLKVKADCILTSDLDLFHHRPYECLLLGYCHGEVHFKNLLSYCCRLEILNVYRDLNLYRIIKSSLVFLGTTLGSPQLEVYFPCFAHLVLNFCIGALSVSKFDSSQIHIMLCLSISELLLEYVPGSKPARCIELFAREMLGGWTSWGNEPLHFQESRYFSRTANT
ncbi:hypothetical protein RHSIM_Rhsim07G0236000 [Rhododendron simsii]|uniref:Methyltransferase-like protein 2 n=1 Tax=Rhododendron simsii TaxID=118357 RepID=A0A834LJX7_RHOSS|nr:hypothetical protein RHSIM_Rhsim07G0236000 [Rhododendron simsii]